MMTTTNKIQLTEREKLWERNWVPWHHQSWSRSHIMWTNKYCFRVGRVRYLQPRAWLLLFQCYLGWMGSREGTKPRWALAYHGIGIFRITSTAESRQSRRPWWSAFSGRPVSWNAWIQYFSPRYTECIWTLYKCTEPCVTWLLKDRSWDSVSVLMDSL